MTAKLVARTGMTPEVVKTVTDEFLGLISETLIEGEPVEIRGFGKFQLRVRQGTTRKNPSTQRMMTIPQRFTVAFIPSAGLKSTLNDL